MYTAVNRGYIACYYAATDPRYEDGDDSDGYIEVYPEYDFSCLGRWAWAASRAVDYLVTLPEVAKDQIGHRPFTEREGAAGGGVRRPHWRGDPRAVIRAVIPWRQHRSIRH
jgi:hypothetical protein